MIASVPKNLNGLVKATLSSSPTPLLLISSGTSTFLSPIFLNLSTLRNKITLCLVSPHTANAVHIISHIPPITPKIAHMTSLHGRYCATNEKRKYPIGDPTVAAHKNRLIAGPVACAGNKSAIVPPKFATVTLENKPDKNLIAKNPPRFGAKAVPRTNMSEMKKETT